MVVKTHHKCAIDLSYTIIDHLRLLVSNFANFHFVLVSQECIETIMNNVFKEMIIIQFLKDR